jgi:hypothetical protein
MNPGSRIFCSIVFCGLAIAYLYWTNPTKPLGPTAPAEYPQVYENFVLKFMDEGTKSRLEGLGLWGTVRFHTYKKCIAGKLGEANLGKTSVDIYICPNLTNEGLRTGLFETIFNAYVHCCKGSANNKEQAKQRMLQELFPSVTVAAQPAP